MTDISREEIRAHLSAVEAQVRAALRIVASESKSVQQANNTLRADLSAALVRLQSDLSAATQGLDSKVDELATEVRALATQRRWLVTILCLILLLFGIVVGLLSGAGWYLIREGVFAAGALPRRFPGCRSFWEPPERPKGRSPCSTGRACSGHGT